MNPVTPTKNAEGVSTSYTHFNIIYEKGQRQALSFFRSVFGFLPLRCYSVEDSRNVDNKGKGTEDRADDADKHADKGERVEKSKPFA